MVDSPFDYLTSQNTGTVLIGCGNILRGDDALGPILIRQLFTDGYAQRVTLVDGGTAGMDVAFKMKGATKVILVDAYRDGSDPGTIYKVPGSELERLPELETFQSHAFRWDHSLAFARWLLDESEYPEEITVFLVSISSTELGADLSEEIKSVLPMLKMLVVIEAGLAVAIDVTISSSGVLKVTDEQYGLDLPETVGVRLVEGVLEVHLLDDKGAGRPTKIVTLSGRRGVEVSDIIDNLGHELVVHGVFDEETRTLKVPVTKAASTTMDYLS